VTEQPHHGEGHSGSCIHFRNDPAAIEAAFPGLAALSSGYGSVRADDGLCALHDRYLGARASCARFNRRDAACPPAGSRRKDEG
jgi:hypothetical protein